jgi:hypothetical protein
MIKSIIHSLDLPEPYLRVLSVAFPEASLIPIPRSTDVYPSIASHPDIFIFTPDRKHFVVPDSLPDSIVHAISAAGFRVILSHAVPKGEYPGTCVLNAVRVGKYIFHNIKYTDLSIKCLASELGLELVHVNQGYARCSVIPVGQDSLITCDPGIDKAARAKGLDSKLVATDKLLLLGQKHGFIGGASGNTPDGKIVFLGDISGHPDSEDILPFLAKYGIKYVSFQELPLFDAGSIIFI